MSRLRVGLVLATALSVMAALPVFANSGGVAAIPLNAGQEADRVTGGGNGSFAYTIDGAEFCYSLSVHNLSANPVAAHVHEQAKGIAGPVVIPLVTPSAATGTVSACITVDATLLAEIAAAPQDYYVNVHTPLHPAGEVRGQLK